jgi:tetratricopeptide (TPR) repeat protein
MAVNLADLYRATGRDGEGERMLRDVLKQDPSGAAAHHAPGLLLVRGKRMPEAVAELESAARLAPGNARYGYVYAVALTKTGRPKPAMEALLRVLARHPYDGETLSALIAYSRGQQSPKQALILLAGSPRSMQRTRKPGSSSSIWRPRPGAEPADFFLTRNERPSWTYKSAFGEGVSPVRNRSPSFKR